MKEERRYRMFQNALYISGQVFILTCVWTIIKMLMYMTVDNTYTDEIMELAGNDRNIMMFTIAIMYMLMVLDSFLHYKIGRVAISVARGGRLKKSYFPLLLAYLALYVWVVIEDFKYDIIDRIVGEIASILLDVLSAGTIVAIFISIFYLYLYNKKHRVDATQGGM